MMKQLGLNTWLNRTTNQYLTEISSGGMEQRFPPEVFHDVAGEPVSNANWIHAPDITDVLGWAISYWIITGDIVTLMDQAARDVVDADILTANDLADKVAEKAVFADKKSMVALLGIIMREFNILRAEHGLSDRTFAQLKASLDNEIDNQ